MIEQIVLLLLGLAMLVGGGDILVRGSSNLARSFGVSNLVVGLTVVAFGTSAPELSINVVAALKSSTEVSFGNVVGSNIANIGLVIGLSALVRPLSVSGTVITREIPMMLLATMVVVILGLDPQLKGSLATFDRSDGLVLLLLLSVFLYYTIMEVLRDRDKDPFVTQATHVSSMASFRSNLLSIALIGAGICLLYLGGQLTIDSASSLALDLGISKAIIGLTVVAIGTSLPEMVTSVIATRKGETDLAIGNVVGSNIFNLLFILGLSSTIYPINLPAGGILDLMAMLFLSLLLLPLATSQKNQIIRAEGALLVILYFGYTVFRFFSM